MRLGIHSKPKSFSTPVRSLQKKLTQLGNRAADLVMPVIITMQFDFCK